MIPIALLHPDVSPRAVKPFQRVNPELTIQQEIRDPQQIQAALIFGGDGTVHRYLPQLHKFNIPVLVVPAGSGNDFAKELGLWNTKLALEAWKKFCQTRANAREIDLGAIRSSRSGEETLFCCVAATGMDAEANRRANQMPSWLRGSGGYIVAALSALKSFEICDFNVSAGLPPRARNESESAADQSRTNPQSVSSGRKSAPAEIHRSGFFVAVGQAHRYGGGLKIAPLAELGDGLLDVCFVGKMNKLKLLLALPTVYFGGHLRLREVEYFRAEKLRIATGRPVDVYGDGEFICQTPVEIRVLPRALRVIVPA
jgi:diacylglycerol kinase (ATP)